MTNKCSKTLFASRPGPRRHAESLKPWGFRGGSRSADPRIDCKDADLERAQTAVLKRFRFFVAPHNTHFDEAHCQLAPSHTGFSHANLAAGICGPLRGHWLALDAPLDSTCAFCFLCARLSRPSPGLAAAARAPPLLPPRAPMMSISKVIYNCSVGACASPLSSC